MVQIAALPLVRRCRWWHCLLVSHLSVHLDPSLQSWCQPVGKS